MTTSTKMPPCLGGKYRPIRHLGSGGMGSVFVVEHQSTGELLALKLLHAHARLDRRAVERFRREARIGVRLKSEHVVRVVDADVADELDGAPFLVMELLEGNDLGAIAGSEAQPPALVIEWLRQTALALDRAHAAGVVHRDLKPENLLLTARDDGSPLVKVLDFGIAKLLGDAPSSDDERPAATATGSVFGTPLYMSPEQAMGGDAVGPAADLWSLAMVAFRLLTGQPYWKATTPAHVLAQIVYEPVLPPSTRGHNLGEAFDRWFVRSCRHAPASRWPSASAQVAALAAAFGVSLSTSQATSTAFSPRSSSPSPTPQTTPRLAVTLGGLAARTDASDEESGQVARFDPFEGVLPAQTARTRADSSSSLSSSSLSSSSLSSSPLSSRSSSFSSLSSSSSPGTLAEEPGVGQPGAQQVGRLAAHASLDDRRVRARLVLLGGGLAAAFATLGAIGMGAALSFGTELRAPQAPTLLQQPVAAAMPNEITPAVRPRSAPPAAGYEALRAGDSGWFAQEGIWKVEGDSLLGRGGQVISSVELNDGTLELDYELVESLEGLEPAGGLGVGLAVGVGFRARPVVRRLDASGYGVNFRLGSGAFNVFKGIDGDWDALDPAFPNYRLSPVVSPAKNHVVVRASGGSFAITVNDRPLTSFDDDSFAKGRVTLWVQSAGTTVRFFNIRISSN